MFHTSDDERYRWLNDRVCAVEGEVRPRPEGDGFDVILDVSLMASTFDEADRSMADATTLVARDTSA